MSSSKYLKMCINWAVQLWATLTFWLLTLWASRQINFHPPRMPEKWALTKAREAGTARTQAWCFWGTGKKLFVELLWGMALRNWPEERSESWVLAPPWGPLAQNCSPARNSSHWSMGRNCWVSFLVKTALNMFLRQPVLDWSSELSLNTTSLELFPS